MANGPLWPEVGAGWLAWLPLLCWLPGLACMLLLHLRLPRAARERRGVDLFEVATRGVDWVQPRVLGPMRAAIRQGERLADRIGALQASAGLPPSAPLCDASTRALR